MVLANPKYLTCYHAMYMVSRATPTHNPVVA